MLIFSLVYNPDTDTAQYVGNMNLQEVAKLIQGLILSEKVKEIISNRSTENVKEVSPPKL